MVVDIGTLSMPRLLEFGGCLDCSSIDIIVIVVIIIIECHAGKGIVVGVFVCWLVGGDGISSSWSSS